MRLCKRHGVEIHWFDRKPVLARDNDREVRSMVRSFFESPIDRLPESRSCRRTRRASSSTSRSHLGHKVLHGGDGLKSAHATGGEMGGSPDGTPSRTAAA